MPSMTGPRKGWHHFDVGRTGTLFSYPNGSHVWVPGIPKEVYDCRSQIGMGGRYSSSSLESSEPEPVFESTSLHEMDVVEEYCQTAGVNFCSPEECKIFDLCSDKDWPNGDIIDIHAAYLRITAE